jgi:hypothetical protein
MAGNVLDHLIQILERKQPALSNEILNSQTHNCQHTDGMLPFLLFQPLAYCW